MVELDSGLPEPLSNFYHTFDEIKETGQKPTEAVRIRWPFKRGLPKQAPFH